LRPSFSLAPRYIFNGEIDLVVEQEILKKLKQEIKIKKPKNLSTFWEHARN